LTSRLSDALLIGGVLLLTISAALFDYRLGIGAVGLALIAAGYVVWSAPPNVDPQ
jgi:hypothetical protein